MEEANEWLDPDSGKHNNKKSEKPKPLAPGPVVQVPVSSAPAPLVPGPLVPGPLVPGERKSKNQKHLEFLNILAEDGLNNNFPKLLETTIVEMFDKKFLDEFKSDLELVKKELLTSDFYPSGKDLILIKFIFMLRRCLE